MTHILVVGAGSIGQRHIRNLWELGHQTVVVDPRQPFDEPCFDTIEEALSTHTLDAAIVAVPTYLHSEVAIRLLQSGIKTLFIEKPLAHNLEAANSILDATKPPFSEEIVIGYSLRFHPALDIIKSLLPQIGTPLYARAEVGQYLPDWHPNEDYRQWYMAHEDKGGGALLDLSHEIDYLQFLFGELGLPQGIVFKHWNSELDIDSDDFADFNIDVDNIVCSVHMDLLDRSYNRRLRVLGTDGTIEWDVRDGRVRLYTPTVAGTYPYDPDRNIQFIEEMKAFVELVETGEMDERFCTLDEGLEVMRVVQQLKEQNGRA